MGWWGRGGRWKGSARSPEIARTPELNIPIGKGGKRSGVTRRGKKPGSQESYGPVVNAKQVHKIKERKIPWR